jgi:dTDP-3,4-didehydro-2,6-dideoxy-alpha-D-glucose 3-reductase
MAEAGVALGLLGCADIATRRILPVLDRIPGVRLAAVASRTAARAHAVTARFGGEPVEGYPALLERPDVDAVYLPLPAGLHHTWIRRALEAGKHVLAEKPLTTSEAETRDLVGLARARGLVLMENFMFPHHRQHETVRALVADGAIGEVRSFSASFRIPARPPGDIRHRPELGGGALLDVAGYPIRAAQLFLGSALEVTGASLRGLPGMEVDIGGELLLRRADGVGALLGFGIADFYESGYRLHGSLGRLSVTHVFTPPANHQPVVRIDRRQRREWIELEPDDQYHRAVAAFVDAVRSGTPVDHDPVLTQARLVDQARQLADRWAEGGSARGRAVPATR